MIRSCEINFPCREATRCFLTDKERGLRLSVTPKGELFFTKNRTVWEEWYVTMEDTPIFFQEGGSILTTTSSGRMAPPTKRLVFRSVKHGVYLSSNASGVVGTCPTPGPDTQWLMMMTTKMMTTTTTTSSSSLESKSWSPLKHKPCQQQQQQQQQQPYSTLELYDNDDDGIPAMMPSPLFARGRSRTSSSGSVSWKSNTTSNYQSPSKSPTSQQQQQQQQQQPLTSHAGLFVLYSEAHQGRYFRRNDHGPCLTSASFEVGEEFFVDDDTQTNHEKKKKDDDDDDDDDHDHDHDDAAIWWEMEFTSGELCFISNPTINQRLRCNVIGNLSLSQQWKGWEVFRFIEASSSSFMMETTTAGGASNTTTTADSINNNNNDNNGGDLIISSWTHHTKVLASDPDGNVFTTENRLGHWERWRVLKVPDGGGVWIQSVAHGRVLAVQATTTTPTTPTTPGGGKRKPQPSQPRQPKPQQQIQEETLEESPTRPTGKFRLFKENLIQRVSANLAPEEEPSQQQQQPGFFVSSNDTASTTSNNKLQRSSRIVEAKLKYFTNSVKNLLQAEEHDDLVQRMKSLYPSQHDDNDYQDEQQQQQQQKSQERQDQNFYHQLHTTTKTKDPKCKWHIEAAHSHVYFVTSPCHKQQISSDKHGPLLTKHHKEWEQWKIERVSPVGNGAAAAAAAGSFTIYSVAHSKYLGSTSTGTVHTTSLAGKWSYWDIVESPHSCGGAVCFISHAHQRQLAADDHGHLSTSFHQGGQNGEWQSWRMEPCMPSSISGSQIAALTAAGTVGLALTLVMPFAVMGAIRVVGGVTATELVGFGVTAEAVAGLSGGAGALLGASVVGTTKAALTKQQQIRYNNNDHDDKNGSSSSLNNNSEHQLVSLSAELNEDTVSNSLRPISAWRNW
jgi:hypothetical protein